MPIRQRRLGRALSLRWRLTAWVAGVMLAAAALVFVVVLVQTGRTLEAQIDRSLHEDITEVQRNLRPYAAGSRTAARLAAVAFVADQPYRWTTTLVYVRIGRMPVVSNHPELFGNRHRDDGEPPTEQAIENRQGALLQRVRPGLATVVVPDVGEMRVLARPLTLGGAPALVAVGAPLASVHDAREGVARAFALAGALSLLLAVLASYVAGARVTAPLRRLAAVAARVDAGDLDPRMEEASGSGEEVRVLAEAFNHMLDRLADAFRGQREFIADASHELRTPLTVIRGQLEVLAALDNPPPHEVARVERVVQAEITRMARLVDDLLLLAAAEQLDFLRVEEFEVQQFVEDLWDGVSLTADRRFELGEIAAGTLRADPDRLAQALRNLARNAIEHTVEGAGLVRLEVVASGGWLEFSVIDDGPGIAPEDRERVFERLYRTDRSRARLVGGSGLGLAIVRAIADAHGGAVAATEGSRGGARITLLLPGFRPRPRSATLPAESETSRAGG